MKIKGWLVAAVLIAHILKPADGSTMTPEELQTILDQGQRITIIDIRNSSQYRHSHIAGAINVPASVIKVKRLPPLGWVVVYGDGVRTDLTLDALTALNTKDGINAELLEGGFGAWQASRLQTTEKAGLSTRGWRYLTYKELKKAAVANPDIVLVDLRTDEEQPLTDIGEEFPLQSVLKLSHGTSGWDIGPCLQNSLRQKLFVLIDNGKDEGLVVARELAAAGIRRIALLTGGEIGLARKGAVDTKTAVSQKSQP